MFGGLTMNPTFQMAWLNVSANAGGMASRR